MTVKKSYNVGDAVWIYGINRSNAKPVSGTVIKAIDLSGAGYTYEHYVIEVPTYIEPILEIRSWHNISQDATGPVGSLRELGNVESTIKFAGTVGFAFDDNPALDSDTEEDGPSSDEIHAALQKSQMDMEHTPLDLKAQATPKRRHFKKKPKT